MTSLWMRGPSAHHLVQPRVVGVHVLLPPLPILRQRPVPGGQPQEQAPVLQRHRQVDGRRVQHRPEALHIIIAQTVAIEGARPWA